MTNINVSCLLSYYVRLSLSYFLFFLFPPAKIKQQIREGWRRRRTIKINLLRFSTPSDKFPLNSMEIEVSSSTPDSVNRVELDSIRVKRKTLQNLLEDCQRALELLNLTDTAPSGDGIETGGSQEEEDNSDSPEREEEFSSSSDQGDPETDKVCSFKLVWQ